MNQMKDGPKNEWQRRLFFVYHLYFEYLAVVTCRRKRMWVD